jgi:hypothetical protein
MNTKKTTIILSIVIFILWLANWFVAPFLITDPTIRGQFGDQFGFINSLFSGFGLAGVVYSIYLQINENREVNKILIHRDFQKELHQIFDRFENSVKTTGWIPDQKEDRLVSSYWYLVFDCWFVCNKQGDKSLKSLWVDYYIHGSESMLKIPAFRKNIVLKLEKKYSFLGTGEDFKIEIMKLLVKLDSEEKALQIPL